MITKNQIIDLEILHQKKITLAVKREDLIHPYVSGNKFRKLKYNLEKAKMLGHDTLLTFGGAYSNHIAAVASAAAENGFKSIGIIRGEELENDTKLNPTLHYAQGQGMQFEFVNRTEYRLKTEPDFLEMLEKKYGAFYLIPEGGTNTEAVKGCEEILSEEDRIFDFICVPMGTGGTISGLINCSKVGQQVLGFPALKGDFLTEEIHKFVQKNNWTLCNQYHFGGYARMNVELISFINDFKQKTGIPLDPFYTGKMMFGILDMVKMGYFKEDARILAIHTGGLQGIAGANERLKEKKLPQIL